MYAIIIKIILILQLNNGSDCNFVMSGKISRIIYKQNFADCCIGERYLQMNRNKHLSPKTKKILTGIGIGFGTVIIFFTSFLLSFNFIVNPITFTSLSDPETEKENKALKEEVQSLQDEIDELKTKAAKQVKTESKNPSTNVQQTPATTQTQSQPVKKDEKPKTTEKSESKDKPVKTDTDKSDETDNNKADEKPETTTDNKNEDENFTPETTVTPEGGTDPEADEPITVIDISE